MSGEDWPRPGGAQLKPHFLFARQLYQDTCKVAGGWHPQEGGHQSPSSEATAEFILPTPLLEMGN